MSQVTFKVTTEVQSKVIANMMVTCIETNACSWLENVQLDSTPVGREEFDFNWYATAKLYEKNFQFTVTCENHEGDDPEYLTVEVTPEKMQAGLNVLVEKYPHHIADMLAENDDAETADAFLQCVVYGDIIYG